MGTSSLQPGELPWAVSSTHGGWPCPPAARRQGAPRILLPVSSEAEPTAVACPPTRMTPLPSVSPGALAGLCSPRTPWAQQSPAGGHGADAWSCRDSARGRRLHVSEQDTQESKLTSPLCSQRPFLRGRGGHSVATAHFQELTEVLCPCGAYLSDSDFQGQMETPGGSFCPLAELAPHPSPPH